MFLQISFVEYLVAGGTRFATLTNVLNVLQITIVAMAIIALDTLV